MTQRQYVSTAHSYAILQGAVLQGLGDDAVTARWPRGRSYYDIAWFRSPYRSGYMQDGSLLGLGATPSSMASSIDQAAPPHLKRYLLSGEPMPRLGTNASLPFNQIPRWGYALTAVGAAALCYVSYKRYKKGKTPAHGG
jgi:hypothetical protein